MTIYRDDIKGNVRAIIQEFNDSLRGEIDNDESFTFDVRDTDTWRKYSKYLTEMEMQKASSSVMKR